MGGRVEEGDAVAAGGLDLLVGRKGGLDGTGGWRWGGFGEAGGRW